MKRDDGDNFDDEELEGMAWEEAVRSSNDPNFKRELLELRQLRDEVGSISDCVILHQNLPDGHRPNRIELTVIRAEDAVKAACGLSEVLDIPIATKDHRTHRTTRPLAQELIRGDETDPLFGIKPEKRGKPDADWFTDKEAESMMLIAGSLDLWKSADQRAFVGRLQGIARDKSLDEKAAQRLALLYIRWVTES